MNSYKKTRITNNNDVARKTVTPGHPVDSVEKEGRKHLFVDRPERTSERGRLVLCSFDWKTRAPSIPIVRNCSNITLYRTRVGFFTQSL